MDKKTLTLVVFGICVFGSCALCGILNINKDKTKTKEDSKNIQSNETTPTLPDDYSGVYYGLTYVGLKSQDKLTITFYPDFLPRNDNIVINAVKHIIRTHLNEYATFSKVQNGLLMFEGRIHNYSVLLIKQDTGEVHTLVIEKLN